VDRRGGGAGAEITAEIRSTGPECIRLSVRVREGASETQHEVTVRPEYLARLASAGETVELLVRRSFAFLLEREPKESILRSFDLSVIGRYFPEYERAMKER